MSVSHHHGSVQQHALHCAEILSLAHESVLLFAARGGGEDIDSGITDLITDLMHLQERWFVEGKTAVDGASSGNRAVSTFLAERDGDDLCDPFIYHPELHGA